MHTVQNRAFARVDEYRNTTGTQEKKSGGGPGVAWDSMRLQAAGMILYLAPGEFYAIRLC